MKCFVCRNKRLKKIKTINSVDINECSDCQLAILNKIVKSKVDLYSFSDYQEEENKLRKRFLKLAKIILTFINQGRFLDVGAGFGLFASILYKLGNFQLETVEPYLKLHYLNKEKINFINHKIIYQKFLAKAQKKFNLILMIDILEHFKNPLSILKKTKHLLTKNGFLIIQTPNYKSLMAKICRQWSWWMVEDHKVIFSPNSLKKILLMSGYQTIYLKTYEDWDDFKKNLDGNFLRIKNKILRKIIKLFFFSLFAPLYFLLRKFIWRLGYGGAIFLIAKRYNYKNEE